jgi:hypothetical protein
MLTEDTIRRNDGNEVQWGNDVNFVNKAGRGGGFEDKMLEGKRAKDKRADKEESATSHWKRTYCPSGVFLTVCILWFG